MWELLLEDGGGVEAVAVTGCHAACAALALFGGGLRDPLDLVCVSFVL